MTAFRLEKDARSVATLTFDLAGEKVNKFSMHVAKELNDVLDSIVRDPHIKLVVLKSAKKGIFIAGADITELQKINTSKDGYEKARQGQKLFDKIEALPMPTIAVIDGAALGGGLECAMSCTYRVVTDSPKCKLGLPEVNLGILPGWGGTQRLPRLVGLLEAMPLMLTGKMLDGKKAVKLGLADAIISTDFVDEQLEPLIEKVLSGGRLGTKRQAPFVEKVLLATPFGRAYIFKKALEEVMEKSKGHYPSPLSIIDILKKSYGSSLKEGLEIEAKAFAELAPTRTCKNLINLFFVSEAAKKDKPKVATTVKDLEICGVLGAGIMGGGIAWLYGSQGASVRVKDLNWEAIRLCLKTARDIFDKLVVKKKMTKEAVSLAMNGISGTVDYSGFSRCELVVEAVVEDLEIKKKVFSELENHISATCIVASNTSSLRIVDMAAAFKRPERFVGMHFFNPVNLMPLVEVIAGPKTSQEAIDKAVTWVRKTGKTPVVVGDCPGFVVNRILLPYMNEMLHLLEEGSDFEAIDKVMVGFGMPMGPFELGDEVGLDVANKVAKVLYKAYGKRMVVADVLGRIVDAGIFGKKGGGGFYLHGKDKKKLTRNPRIDGITGAHRGLKITEEDVVGRAVLIMINEAARILEEGFCDGAESLDLAMIMGTGFPPFRGGLLRYADELGVTRVTNRLNDFKVRFGDRFEPCELLKEMSKDGRSFFLDRQKELTHV